MIYAKVHPMLLLKHTVTGGVATAVGNYAYRKSVKQMLHRCHMVITNTVTSTNKLPISFHYALFIQVF